MSGLGPDRQVMLLGRTGTEPHMAAVSHHSAGRQRLQIRDVSATGRTPSPLKDDPSLRSQFNEWIEVNGVWERPWVWEWGARVSGLTCRRGVGR